MQALPQEHIQVSYYIEIVYALVFLHFHNFDMQKKNRDLADQSLLNSCETCRDGFITAAGEKNRHIGNCRNWCSVAGVRKMANFSVSKDVEHSYDYQLEKHLYMFSSRLSDVHTMVLPRTVYADIFMIAGGGGGGTSNGGGGGAGPFFVYSFSVFFVNGYASRLPVEELY